MREIPESWMPGISHDGGDPMIANDDGRSADDLLLPKQESGQDARDDHLEGTSDKGKDPRIGKEKRRKPREFNDQNKSNWGKAGGIDASH